MPEPPQLFRNLREARVLLARVLLESWRVEYNERLPSGALGYPERAGTEKDEPI
jgi:hypothetical protein